MWTRDWRILNLFEDAAAALEAVLPVCHAVTFVSESILRSRFVTKICISLILHSNVETIVIRALSDEYIDINYELR